jgi:hypothetical protein
VTRDVFKTKRCVNPLDPVYEVKYKNGENYVHGNIEGSKPVTNSLYSYADPFNLKTADIDGTTTGSKNRINKFVGQNFNLRTDDFRGATSNSLKKGIETKRMTNPLNPDYLLPGHKEFVSSNNPYGSTLHAKSAKNRNEDRVKKIEKKEGGSLNPNIGKENVATASRPISNHGDDKILSPNEVFGFNNQIYNEDQ